MRPSVQIFHQLAKAFTEEQHPRIPGGQTGGGEFTSGAGGETTGTGTKSDPIVTSDVLVAAKALGENKYIRLKSVRQVSTLLGKLKELADDAKSKGAKAPLYDLCHVTVPGTSLFCASSKDIPRVQMPQLKGVPTPGSKADALPKDANGEVNLADEFVKHLAAAGIAVHDDVERADFLKASQNELNGAKVAGMMAAIESGKNKAILDEPLFVDNSSYILDGHHRWAAAVGATYREGLEKPLTMKVKRVDMEIIPLLKAANNFAIAWGIPQASVAKSKCGCTSCGCSKDSETIAEFVKA